MDPGPGDFDRGGWDMTVNYKIGWAGNGHWYNYTRTFPAGSYNVYAALSHGDPAASGVIGGSLQLVTAGQTTTNQTLTQLGTFSGPRTGGWGSNRLLPLMDGGNVASIALSGEQTIRFTLSDGDYDFLAFVPGSAAGPRFSVPTLSGTSVTITWTGTGVLQEATVLTGSPTDWTDVSPPPTGNTYQATSATTGNRYYRIRP